MNRYATEFVGTFLLVLTIGLSVLGGTPLAPLAIGGVLIGIVFMGGHVSGAHYNPAVSFGLVLRGSFATSQLAPYVGAQVLGALVAGVTVYAITGRTFAPAPAGATSMLAALLVETFYSFALVLVVLNVATAPTLAGNSFYGLAIGTTVMAAAYAGGPISGGAYNPAVGLGPALVHLLVTGGNISHVWLYVVGPLAGGALAAAMFRLQHNVGFGAPPVAP
jgi:aquaporin Z